MCCCSGGSGGGAAAAASASVDVAAAAAAAAASASVTAAAAAAAAAADNISLSDLQGSIMAFDIPPSPLLEPSATSTSKLMIVSFSQMQLQELSINYRAMMLVAEAYPSSLPLMLHIFAVNMQVPERTIKVLGLVSWGFGSGFRVRFFCFWISFFVISNSFPRRFSIMCWNATPTTSLTFCSRSTCSLFLSWPLMLKLPNSLLESRATDWLGLNYYACR